jgi:hypothetical protein
MKTQMQNSELKIIAGPDSIDDYNLKEIYEISEIKAFDKPAIFGSRTVGLKSRTNFDSQNSDKGFMGFDFEVIMENFDILQNGGKVEDFKPLPSVLMANEIFDKTQMLCATEIMLPEMQLACIAKSFKNKPFMVWNPAVDQLGWHIRQMAKYAQINGWTIGLKNAKWLGEDYAVAENINYEQKTSLEVSWEGLAQYANIAPERVLIQRGCDLPQKGNYRNLPIHQTALRTKINLKSENIKLFFDPSHAFGPKMRDHIVDSTVEAMKTKINDFEYLYDGILVEVGTAKCDTHQHISVEELKILVGKISEFRTFADRVKI